MLDGWADEDTARVLDDAVSENLDDEGRFLLSPASLASLAGGVGTKVKDVLATKWFNLTNSPALANTWDTSKTSGVVVGLSSLAALAGLIWTVIGGTGF